MERSVIDLGDYLQEGEKVISGRDQGQQISQQVHLEELIQDLGESEHLTIKLPEQVRSISPAFLEGLIGGAIRAFGQSVFRQKVEFTRAQRYDVVNDLNEAIDRILTERNVLAY